MDGLFDDAAADLTRRKVREDTQFPNEVSKAADAMQAAAAAKRPHNTAMLVEGTDDSAGGGGSVGAASFLQGKATLGAKLGGASDDSASCDCEMGYSDCSCERLGECYRPTPVRHTCRIDSGGTPVGDCWKQDSCPPEEAPHISERWCPMFAWQYGGNWLTVCSLGLKRWVAHDVGMGRQAWDLKHVLPSFVDVWYTGFGGQPADDRGGGSWGHGSNRGWNHRQHVAQGLGQLQGNPISIMMNKGYVWLCHSGGARAMHMYYKAAGWGAWQGYGFNDWWTGWGWDGLAQWERWASYVGIFSVYASGLRPAYDSGATPGRGAHVPTGRPRVTSARPAPPRHVSVTCGAAWPRGRLVSREYPGSPDGQLRARVPARALGDPCVDRSLLLGAFTPNAPRIRAES